MDSTLIESALDHEYAADLKDPAKLRHELLQTMVWHVGRDPTYANSREWFDCLAHLVRSVLVARYVRTARTYHRKSAKRVYYLSMEYLPGSSMRKHLIDLDIEAEVSDALKDFGVDVEAVIGQEQEAALGNGGLGRLASCYLDAMAAHGFPGFGYGIRYDFGMFRQSIENGVQVEHAESWLSHGSPWEFLRPTLNYKVGFYGRVVRPWGGPGQRSEWVDTETVEAAAYDISIAGFQVPTVNNLRLWSARATESFDLKYFNQGDYIEAVKEKTAQETLSKVLYPSDTTYFGQELRLKQQYFFVCASLQDILSRYSRSAAALDNMPNEVAIQLNDTHPVLAIPELMRLFIDEYGLEFGRAWDICRRVFSYTNHTLLPEALETWPISMLRQVLPRHLELIYEINYHFLEEVKRRFPGDTALLGRLSMVDDQRQRIRMAHLAVVGSHLVNGVAALHTKLLRETLFADFAALWPDKFVNVTNGITQRRWLRQANPGLTNVLAKRVKGPFINKLDLLREAAPLATDAGFQDEVMAVKRDNKLKFATFVKDRLGLELNPDSLFDIQIKRIHEYKRQLLNLLHIVARYNECRKGNKPAVPRTFIFGGKAAPAYHIAKQIIRLANDVARVVNNDPASKDHLRVLFMPNYSVSLAERIIPAADLSEQISMAGTEASGTGNMKFALNGALTIGTLDGANIEIAEEVGRDNIFIFGLDADGVRALKKKGYNPWEYFNANQGLREVLEMIGRGYFSPDEPHRYGDLLRTLLEQGDRYLLLADYQAYVDTQAAVDQLYLQPREWTRKAILNITNMGKFSCDRSIETYASEIWKVQSIEV